MISAASEFSCVSKKRAGFRPEPREVGARPRRKGFRQREIHLTVERFGRNRQRSLPDEIDIGRMQRQRRGRDHLTNEREAGVDPLEVVRRRARILRRPAEEEHDRAHEAEPLQHAVDDRDFAFARGRGNRVTDRRAASGEVRARSVNVQLYTQCGPRHRMVTATNTALILPMDWPHWRSVHQGAPQVAQPTQLPCPLTLD